LKKQKSDFIEYPRGVETILEEQNSTWNFQLDFVNTCPAEKQIALFSGLVDRSRYQILDGSKQYAALGGGLVITPYAVGSVIKLNDDPRLLNKISGLVVSAIATQEHHNGASEPAQINQVIYKDGTGLVSVTSKDFFLDFLQEFVKQNPLRLYEMQFSTNTPLILFGSRLAFKDLNPLNREQMQYLNLEDYYTPDNQVGTKIIVPAGLYIGDQTFMAISLPASSQVTMSMKFSAYASNLHLLKNTLKTESFFKSIAAATSAKTSKTATDSASSSESK
jgi:hypothetical protein